MHDAIMKVDISSLPYKLFKIFKRIEFTHNFRNRTSYNKLNNVLTVERR